MSSKRHLFSRLHVKVLLILVVMGIIAISVALVRRASVNEEINSVTNEYLQSRQKSFEVSRGTTNDLIRALSYDYSIWDEMVDAVESEDETWFDEQIPNALNTYKVDAAWVLDTKYRQVYSANTAGNTEVSFPIRNFDTNANRLFKDGYFVEFNTLINGEIYQIFGAPIQPGSDIARATAPRGYFFVARKLSREDIVNRLSLVNDSDVKITSNIIDREPVIVPSEGLLQFESPILNEQGTKIGAYQVENYSEYMKSTSQVLLLQYRFFLAAMIILPLFMTLVFYFIISIPLRGLSESIANRDSKKLKTLVRRKDELGEAAQLVTRVQEQEIALKLSAEETMKARDELEKRAKEAERMNDLMVGRELRMVELKKQLQELKVQSSRKKGGSA